MFYARIRQKRVFLLLELVNDYSTNFARNALKIITFYHYKNHILLLTLEKTERTNNEKWTNQKQSEVIFVST
jgi:hypothetical protein